MVSEAKNCAGIIVSPKADAIPERHRRVFGQKVLPDIEFSPFTLLNTAMRKATRSVEVVGRKTDRTL